VKTRKPNINNIVHEHLLEHLETRPLSTWNDTWTWKHLDLKVEE